MRDHFLWGSSLSDFVIWGSITLLVMVLTVTGLIKAKEFPARIACLLVLASWVAIVAIRFVTTYQRAWETGKGILGS